VWRLGYNLLTNLQLTKLQWLFMSTNTLTKPKLNLRFGSGISSSPNKPLTWKNSHLFHVNIGGYEWWSNMDILLSSLDSRIWCCCNTVSCGTETWTLTITEKNKVLTRVSGPLRNENASLSITTEMEWNWLRWSGSAAWRKTQDICVKLCYERCGGNKPSARPRQRWKVIKLDFELDDMDWIELPRVQ
jgi:hypothetical protein